MLYLCNEPLPHQEQHTSKLVSNSRTKVSSMAYFEVQVCVVAAVTVVQDHRVKLRQPISPTAPAAVRNKSTSCGCDRSDRRSRWGLGVTTHMGERHADNNITTTAAAADVGAVSCW
jgi:hypothetical protein